MISVLPKNGPPTRLTIAVMLFTACFVAYMTRGNMSINIIAMTERAKSGSKAQRGECLANLTSNNMTEEQSLNSEPDHGTRYHWDSKLQGLLIGAYYYGYIITSGPGGLLAERFGPTNVVLISSLVTGVLTILSPLCSSWHAYVLFANRFLVGLCGGVIYPCLHCLVSRWAPPEEKGKFIGSLLGGTLGTVVSWPLLGSIIEVSDWTWSFYTNGILVLIWCIFWKIFVADSPSEHPRITDEEKTYIVSSLGKTVKKHTSLPPYRRIFSSLSFWALAVLHYGNLWGLFFLMNSGPMFVANVLGFNVGKTGVLAALPHLARMIFGIIFGIIGDMIRSRKWLSTTTVRKSFTLFSHTIPGALLLALNLSGCDINWAISLLTFSLGFNGASTLTNLQNSQDLAPNFAGTVYGIINCIGSTAGFIGPTVVGYITADHPGGLHEWHIIFCIGAAFYLASALFFVIFGTGEIMPWNEIEEVPSSGIDNRAFDNTNEEKAAEQKKKDFENSKV